MVVIIFFLCVRVQTEINGHGQAVSKGICAGEAQP